MDKDQMNSSKKYAFIILGAVAVIAVILFISFSNNNLSTGSKNTSTTKTGSVLYKSEREQALKAIQEYQLQKDLQNPKIDKTTTLFRAFGIMTQDKVMNPSTGWFAVKEGDRIVVGWQGTKAGMTHTPQWQYKDSKLITLNGTSVIYTPELEPQFSGIAGTDETDKKIYERLNSLYDSEVDPRYNQMLDNAGTSDTKIGEANEWVDAQENILVERVATEFGKTKEEVDKIWKNVSFKESDQRGEFAQSRGKILSDEEISDLIKSQGSL